jgi:hypothetical protein
MSVDEVANEIERATKSKQPRFKDDRELANYFIKMISRADETLPDYKSDTRPRDLELLRLVRSESLLSGVVSGAVSRDKNRGWTLTGAARQVSVFSKKLHSVQDGEGWRRFVSLNANSWYVTDLGYISEIGFRFRGGPAETLWHLDPTRCRITGITKPPMYYYPNTGKVSLKRNEYIHGNSMPSVEEKMKYAGFSAVERALEFVRLMIGLNRHQLEKLGVVAPKGILLGKGIKRDEWEQAIEQYEEDMKNKGRAYYEGVLMLFTQSEASDIVLTALSTLPDNFELKEFIDVVMQAYSLAFGYPVGEFWAIQSGSFGRTGEMKVQQQQATAKGELDFALSFQEQLQTYFLPSTVDFQFDQRNDSGDLIKAESTNTAFQIVKEAYETGSKGELEPIISQEEARMLMAELGIIPKEWAKDDEDITSSDLQDTRERMLERAGVIESIQAHPDEPVVMYSHNIKDVIRNSLITKETTDFLNRYHFPPGKITVLWNSGREALARRYY